MPLFHREIDQSDAAPATPATPATAFCNVLDICSADCEVLVDKIDCAPLCRSLEALNSISDSNLERRNKRAP